MKKIIILCSLICLSVDALLAQTKHAFWDDVQTIKAYDKIYAPAEHPIVFMGSSSIRRWTGLQQAFGKYNVLNRGVGGEVIDDAIYYLDDMVFAYKPRQVVIYVGENDIPIAKNTADSIVNKTVKLYTLIREKLPDVPIVYISLKPSPSREKYLDKTIEANQKIQAFLNKEKNVVFVDVYNLMLKDGKLRPELFIEDRLHMKPEGYAIWEKALKRYLLKP
ncbi:GDSL-type esterase/lipase family protein [Mucilaginibacter auburnensis]|uniref:Lysophospholipase L1-like esterase n=1 Tax=Mucilaginibacter auburnensis TaxID=1457233 RepID=A0A2H9VVR5_9SPHI|nr:GDSL-type esterase/lipase family protein [Mucilaginibacter auburnensis]PJJ84872.1 lysophospholipase L1-like esterase [Mucilaginibacter auburnensis]